jgi:tetratricopeptide (TPR) repeat protein
VDEESRLHCLATWINFLVSHGRFQQALSRSTELVRLSKLKTISDHTAAHAHQALGNLLGSCRRWDEAEAALRKSLAEWERASTVYAPTRALTVRHQLCRLDHARGRYVDAEHAYLDLVRYLESAGPVAETVLLAVLLDYALLLEQTGRPSQASEVRRRAQDLTNRRSI